MSYRAKHQRSNKNDNMFSSFNDLGKSMSDLGKTMSETFSTVFNNSDINFTTNSNVQFTTSSGYTNVTTINGTTIIKKGDKTIIIDDEGSVTVDGKQMVEMCDAYNTTASNYNHSATDAPTTTTTKKKPTVEDVCSDYMTPVTKSDLQLLKHELSIKFENIYWYIGLGCMFACSLAILVCIAVNK